MLPVRIISEACSFAPDVILIGHSGSTSAHPVIAKITCELRRSLPHITIIYGGVFPTYHWREILRDNPQIDFIVRGEGERTTLALITALEERCELGEIRGIAYREGGVPVATAAARMIANLDDYRIGWELIDFGRYSYWGDKRAVVVQFSRGCPHNCSYCGQRGFWTRFRHRDPRRFAAELAYLHRAHGVEVVNLADENPTADRGAWLAFLHAMIEENVPLIIVGSTRADDIVRDADILHLYKQAGVARWLLGIENYDPATLARIRKGGSPEKDRRAIQLLRGHGIISMATYVVGFEEERPRDYLRSLLRLLRYDPDQIQLIYITPHRWTPLFRQIGQRTVIDADVSHWDYKHQVLSTRHLPAWGVMMLTKLIEVIMQTRPRALMRLLFHRDAAFRAAMWWYYNIGRRVYFHELRQLLHRQRKAKAAVSLVEFWGEPQDQSANVLAPPARQVARAAREGYDASFVPICAGTWERAVSGAMDHAIV